MDIVNLIDEICEYVQKNNVELKKEIIFGDRNYVEGHYELSTLIGHFKSRVDTISKRTAVAISNSGEILMLFRINEDVNNFEDEFTMHWASEDKRLWSIKSGDTKYIFTLPNEVLKNWLDKSINDIELKANALAMKGNDFAMLTVYYKGEYKLIVKTISINKYFLEKAKGDLKSTELSSEEV